MAQVATNLQNVCHRTINYNCLHCPPPAKHFSVGCLKLVMLSDFMDTCILYIQGIYYTNYPE